MFHKFEEGSAIVSNVPIPPFVPLQHQQVNVATINYLANYSLRAARERGWLQTEEDMRQATEVYASNDARPLLEQEGYAHKGDDVTFFYAGVEASLAGAQPHFHFPPVPSTLLLSSRFFASHVGNSSYTIYGELHSYLEGKEESTRQLLGHFKVTTVLVSKMQRTVRPIPPPRRAVIAEACEQTKAYLSAHVPDAGIARLNPRSLLAASELIADAETADLNRLVLLPHAGTTCADGAVRETRFRQLHTLRETDMDFNFHVNQLAMQQLVLNSFRGSLRQPESAGAGEKESIYPRLINDDVKPLVGDLLLRKLRIDYVREIPMTHEAAEVCLFPLDDSALEKILRSKPGARLQELVEIGFFSCGVRKTTDKERFLATVGVFSCYV